MEFHFTLLRQSEKEIEIEMYNTFYKLVRAQPENGESTTGTSEEWGNAANNKMSMSAELAKAIVEAVKNSVVPK